jgi:hypothetical protein
MIVVVTRRELDPVADFAVEIADHGVNSRTGERIALPALSPQALGARYSPAHGGFVLPEPSLDQPTARRPN